ncbi:MAG TPA: hypothetical protein DCQ06_11780, partial [Myxococcales bacterium]|nr:hypothetical protein [Myxococcales bacterium]
NACTTKDVCNEGKSSGEGVQCDDSNPCTTDSCTLGKGCAYSNNSAACSDGNACTLKDACIKGACTSGSAVTCDDSNPCTKDLCDKAKGCQFVNLATDCDDGNACTAKDKCISGLCKGVGLTCNDGKVCTTDSCKPSKGCLYTDTQDPCSDGDACTLNDKCAKGVCVGGKKVGCNDGNDCTTDSCEPKTGCANKPNTNACEDGNACTNKDSCAAGVCKGAKVTCNDGNPCTDDFCDITKGCNITNNSLKCDDGTACTKTDTCASGKCVGVQLDCDDANPCTKDSCDSKKGCVNANVPDKTNCGGLGICQSGTCSKGSSLNPAASCKEILQGWSAAPNGTYWVDPDGQKGPGSKYQVYCEMKDFGGGWMVINNQWLSKLTTLKNLIPGGKCQMTSSEWRSWDQFNGSTSETHFCSASNKFSHWPSYKEMRQVGVRIRGYTAGKSDSFDAYTNCYGNDWQGSFCFGPSAEMYSMTTSNISLINGELSPTYNQVIKLKKTATDFEFRSREEGPQKEGIIWKTGKIYLR